MNVTISHSLPTTTLTCRTCGTQWSFTGDYKEGGRARLVALFDYAHRHGGDQPMPLAGSVTAPGYLKPGGTYAAYRRHQSRNEQPCDECVQGYKAWERERGRARYAARTGRGA